MDHLHWTEVDGVTTIWTEAPEPLRAMLMFRTGQADETAITAGHTHLVEHFAMAQLVDLAQRSNGFVSATSTGFVTMGSPDEVCSFFHTICASLASLSTEQLEVEKKILLAEAARRPYDVNKTLLIWRYGAAGYGLGGLPEFGIRGATIEQLQAWREQRFTRGNAILWLTGPIPPSLRLELPPGEKQASPQPAPIQSTFPAWFLDNQCGGVAASAMIPRQAEGPIFNTIARKRMVEELRQEQALSYSPMVTYEPLTADVAHLVLFADSEQNRRAELADAFGKMFERSAEVDESEVEIARKLYVDALTGALAPSLADQLAFEVHQAAIDWITGKPYESLDQLVEEAHSVNAEQVMAFAQVVRNNTLFAVPGNVRVQPWMGVGIPPSSVEAVRGRIVRPVDAPIQTDWLMVSPDGVSLKHTIDLHQTVHYASLAAALHYDDGALILLGSDATWLKIEPTLWRNGPKICEEIRSRIPTHLVLEQGPRQEDAIPKPRTTAWQRFIARLK